jgi:hypothetical protein
MVPKDRIELVILPEDQHEAPIKRWNNFTSRSTANISALVGGYYVEGELQLPQSAKDAVHALIQQLGTFFPITRASIIGPDAQRIGAPVLFVNKGYLSCFHADSATTAESPAAELESSLS